MSFTLSIDDFVITFFTAGVGRVDTCPCRSIR
jgi:ABC-type spermidine/putrescine transport system permease subunit II